MHSTVPPLSLYYAGQKSFFREDSRLVRRAALKRHSARNVLGSKSFEQEGTEVLCYLCDLLFKSLSLRPLVQYLLDAVSRPLGHVWLLAKYGYGYLMANLDFLTAEGLVLRLPRTSVAEPPRDGKLIEFLRSADLVRLGGFPDSTVPYARSLLLLAAGDIEAAHRIAQESSSADGAYVHGMIHRIEDDFDNARYWFFRAGVHPASPEIYRRAAANSQRIASHPTWDAGGVTDWLEESRAKGIGEELRAVLRIESEVLLEHFTGKISG